MVGACYRPSHEDEQADEVFVLRQDFNAQMFAGNAMQAAQGSGWVAAFRGI